MKTVVGAFFIVVFGLFAFLCFQVEDLSQYYSKAYYLKVRLPTADLEKGSPVKLAGVKVGVVTGSTIDPTSDKMPVLVTFRVDEGATIYDTCQAKVVKSGLLGKAVLGIDLIKTDNSRALADGDIMEKIGEEVSIDAVLINAKKIVEDVHAMTDHARKGEGTLGKLVMKDDAYNEIIGAVKPFKQTFSNAATITATINKGEGTIGKLVMKDEAYDEIMGALKPVKETFANAATITASINEGKGTIGKLVKDEEMADNAKGLVTDAKRAFSNLGDVTQDIKDGKGTLGKLASDDALASDVKDTIKGFKDTGKNLSDITGQVRKGEGTVGKLVYDDKILKSAQNILDSIQAALEDLRESAPVASFAGAVLGAF